MRRVVIALIDPTSRGEGGVARLRQAGLIVEVGLLADEARLVLGPSLDALITCRPFVIWPYAVSDDGATGGLADVVMSADGSVAEAVPGSHLPGVLDLAGLPPA